MPLTKKLGTGLESHESEDVYELDLDRATVFVNPGVAPPLPAPLLPTPSDSEELATASPAPNNDLNSVLTRLLDSYPVVAPVSPPHLSYLPARSVAQLSEMPTALRQALEWSRARAMLKDLPQEVGLPPLDSKQLFLWCRAYDPHLVALVSAPSEEFCPLCGKLAYLISANRCLSCKDVLPKLSSLSTVSPILNALPSGWDSYSGKLCHLMISKHSRCR